VGGGGGGGRTEGAVGGGGGGGGGGKGVFFLAPPVSTQPTALASFSHIYIYQANPLARTPYLYPRTPPHPRSEWYLGPAGIYATHRAGFLEYVREWCTSTLTAEPFSAALLSLLWRGYHEVLYPRYR